MNNGSYQIPTKEIADHAKSNTAVGDFDIQIGSDHYELCITRADSTHKTRTALLSDKSGLCIGKVYLTNNTMTTDMRQPEICDDLCRAFNGPKH